MDKLDELLKKITAHEMATMDAPYFGWSREFINGYIEALTRVKKDVEKLRSE